MAEAKAPDPPITTTSTEEKHTMTSVDSLNATEDKNNAAAADVENLLAELRAEGSLDRPEEPETNGLEKAEATEPEEIADAEPKELIEGKTETNDVEEAGFSQIKQAGVKTEEQPETKSTSQEHGSNDRRSGFSRGSNSRDHHNNHGGKKEFRDYKANVKTDFSKLPDSSDPVEIRKQVEFYFSDSNLPMDEHLFSLVGGSKNNPVELTAIHSFKRMRRFKPFTAIVDALKESTFLELADNDTAVKRKVPLPNPEVVRHFGQEAFPRSVYVKGFGEEGDRTQFEIEEFFEPFGPTNQIRLRRTHPDKMFKGSIFCEFQNEELQKKFLALEPKPQFKGQELMIKSKQEYVDEKAKDHAGGKLKGNNGTKSYGHYNDRKRKTGHGQDERNWDDRRKEDQKSGFQERRDRDGRRGHHGGGHRGYGTRGGGRGRDYRHDRNSREVPKVRITSESEHPAPLPKPRDSTPATTPDKQESIKAETKTQVTGAETAPVARAEPTSPSKKRSREDDEIAGHEKPAKKADRGDGYGKGSDEAVMAEAKTEIAAP